MTSSWNYDVISDVNLCKILINHLKSQDFAVWKRPIYGFRCFPVYKIFFLGSPVIDVNCGRPLIWACISYRAEWLTSRLVDVNCGRPLIWACISYKAEWLTSRLLTSIVNDLLFEPVYHTKQNELWVRVFT